MAPDVAGDPEMDVDYLTESEPNEPLIKKKRGKKRKVSDESNTKALTGQPATKRVRGKRGILKKLVEMPMDLLFEIFGQLDPHDILNLARTTKDLRAILMSRSSISVWKRARNNVDEFPDCPDDLSEPEYAELAFGKSCYFCHRNLASNIIVWEVRFRTCTKCIHEKFTPIYGYGYPDYPGSLFDLLPRCPVPLKKGRHSHRYSYLYSELHSQWTAEYKALSKDERHGWLERKLLEREPIKSHTEACQRWVSGVRAARMQEKTSLIDERRAIIQERIKKLGWGDELEKAATYQNLPNDSIISKACQKEVTEKVLSNLEGHLNDIMTNLRDCRLEKERASTFRERLQLIAKIREESVAALPINSLAPCSADLFRLPAVHDAVMDSLTCEDFAPGDFDFIRESFAELCLQWRHVIEQKLLDMIKKSPVKDYDPETVLQLATTSFACSACATSIKYPQVLVHKCATSQSYESATGFESAIRSVFRENNWNTKNYLSFDAPQFEPATKLLKLWGLDPNTTTADELDALDPIFECLSCNSLSRGRMMMDWPTAVSHHLKTSFHIEEPDVQLVDEDDATTVRGRMLEATERAQSSSHHSQSLICTHCRQKDNLMKLKQHVLQAHGKQNPTNEDIVLGIQVPFSREAYWLWPPRLDDAPAAPAQAV